MTTQQDDRALPGLEGVTAADLMSCDVVAVGEHESVVMAGYLMRQARVHHLPVVRGARVVGALDEATLAAAITRLTWDDLRHPVHTVMHRDVVSVRPSSSLHDVAEHLGFSRSGLVVVTDDRQLVGVITAADVVSAVARLVGPPLVPRAPA